MTKDENDEVQYGDRIPYVIISGDPQTRLVDKAVSPEELLQNECAFHLCSCNGSEPLLSTIQAHAIRCFVLHIPRSDPTTRTYFQLSGC